MLYERNTSASRNCIAVLELALFPSLCTSHWFHAEGLEERLLSPAIFAVAQHWRILFTMQHCNVESLQLLRDPPNSNRLLYEKMPKQNPSELLLDEKKCSMQIADTFFREVAVSVW